MNKVFINSLTDLKFWFENNLVEKVSFDTETSSLRQDELELVGFSFCNGDSAFYFDYFIQTNEVRKQVIELLKLQFKKNIKKLIMHSAEFDLRVLWKYGIRDVTNNIFDTKVAAHLYNENNSTSLKDLAKKDLGIIRPIKYKSAISDGFHSKKFYNYGINDAIWTYQLCPIYYERMKKKELLKLFFKIEMPFQFVLRDLGVNGILTDQPEIERLKKQLKKDLFNYQESMCKLAGLSYSIQYNLFDSSKELIGPNFNSSQQLIKILTKNLGLKLTKKTEKGLLSTGKEVIKSLKGKHKFIDILETYKAASKLYGGFLVPSKDHIQADGRIRTSYWYTTTGRLKSSKPNLQQVPRQQALLDMSYRKCFIAPPGKKFIIADYSGEELRVLGEVTQDPALLEAFREGRDLHLEVANRIFDLNIPKEILCETHSDWATYKSKYKKERHIAKNGVNFPVIYGSTPAGIAGRMGIPVEAAISYVEQFFDMYPWVKKKIRECENFIRQNFYIRSISGRIRHFDHIDKKAVRQAFNFLIQGYCADLLKIAMAQIRVDLACIAANLKPVLTIHDEAIYEVDEDAAEVCSKQVKYIMENCVKLSIPLKIDIKIVSSYGD